MQPVRRTAGLIVGIARRLFILAAFAAAAPAALAQNEGDFVCGGPVENESWKLWEATARGLLKKAVIEDSLNARGDTYALYDLQAYLQNLAAMALRCGRMDRLEDMAQLIGSTYSQLSETRQGGRGWVCRGGRVCSAANKMADNEVMLTSSQFLGLALRVANGLSDNKAAGKEARDFVEQTAEVAQAHLARWSRGSDPLRINERLAMSAATVKDGASKQFFTDVDLWIITAYAELAGIYEARDDVYKAARASAEYGRTKESLVGLLKLLQARTTTLNVGSGPIGRVTAADLDRGFWRFHPESRYAGYTSPEKPVVCDPKEKEPRVIVKPDAIPIVNSVGWDFSHARRLVHAMDAIDRNREALVRVFGVPSNLVPPKERGQQFAAQLVTAVWNGDAQRPLFANFWDGSKGWYRVDYDRGGRACFEGYPPYGLSDSFATGGFATWGRHYAVLSRLGERIYELARSKDEADKAFIEARYPGLGGGGSSSTRTLTRLMFWPSLVRPAK